MVMEEADGLEVAALVMATTCDQMRRAGGMIDGSTRLPVFLLNVPATWQTSAAQQYYGEEVQRLGRFLVRIGGEAPTPEKLARVMIEYNRAREQFCSAWTQWPARWVAEAVMEYRGCRERPPWRSVTGSPAVDPNPRNATEGVPYRDCVCPNAMSNGGHDARAPGIPLALVGGPLLPQDHGIFDLVEQVGGRIVLNATETGERTLPAAFQPGAVQQDPFQELCAVYHAIPDVFRRPNDPLYEWLGREIQTRQVRGLLLRRYLWCDLWHAEWRRLKEWSPVPVLEIDVADDEPSVHNRTLGRIEAFLESLRSAEKGSGVVLPRPTLPPVSEPPAAKRLPTPFPEATR
jgi:benzoyl-CoA reductase/2-hydroxyglutaryl-CoA dehydratase subunit BcrC/BadD/HgdB